MRQPPNFGLASWRMAEFWKLHQRKFFNHPRDLDTAKIAAAYKHTQARKAEDAA